jgi:hypothetical protein
VQSLSFGSLSSLPHFAFSELPKSLLQTTPWKCAAPELVSKLRLKAQETPGSLSSHLVAATAGCL